MHTRGRRHWRPGLGLDIISYMIYTFDAGAAPEYEIEYYATENGECPVQEMLDAMPPKHAAKAAKFFALLEQKGPAPALR